MSGMAVVVWPYGGGGGGGVIREEIEMHHDNAAAIDADKTERTIYVGVGGGRGREGGEKGGRKEERCKREREWCKVGGGGRVIGAA